ncbi:TIGR00266 family protein [bacterium]|nr:TIGR00266 family protein [bacterium]
MRIEIQNRPAYAMAQVHLAGGESIVSEGGAMVSMSDNVTVSTSTFAAPGSGGMGALVKGLKRMLTGESFFMNKFTASGEGHVILAPVLVGDVEHIPMDGSVNVIVQSSSYLAASGGITTDTQFSGLKGFFSGESVFWIKCSGAGDLIINAFGGIFHIDVDGTFICDTGHIAAFEDTLDYKVKKVGGWKSTILSGEGLVTEFSGRGRLYMQTHNSGEFGRYIGRKLPPRRQ